MEYSVSKWKQKLEINKHDYSNALTTISKDNLILEIDDDGKNTDQTSHETRVDRNDGGGGYLMQTNHTVKQEEVGCKAVAT